VVIQKRLWAYIAIKDGCGDKVNRNSVLVMAYVDDGIRMSVCFGVTT
jgi:hypothetical protein